MPTSRLRVVPAHVEIRPHIFLANADVLQCVKKHTVEGNAFFKEPLRRLVEEAEAKLAVPPQSIVNKKLLPPSGDPHDYLSLAPYWWPNPNSADGLPYVRRDGEVNPERFRYDVAPLEKMVEAVRPLTFAYFFTDDERYAQHAARLLRTWFIDPKTRMNPHLEFAQVVPGRPQRKGAGIIETVRFRWLLDGVALLVHSSSWQARDRSAVRDWFSEYRQWLLQSAVGQQTAQRRNNQGTWYAMQVALYSVFLGDAQTAKQWIEGAKERIARHIEPDGSQPEEFGRTRSFHYSMFNLQALFDLACLGTHVGSDLFWFATPDGRSIRRALEYLLPFATGKAQWVHPQIDEPHWYILAETLRRAAVHVPEPAYETALQQLPPGALAATDIASLGEWLDLVEPPSGYRSEKKSPRANRAGDEGIQMR